MILIGDADSVRTSHTVELFVLLGRGMRDAGMDGSGILRARLTALPATTHYDILFFPMLATIATDFLEARQRKDLHLGRPIS